MVWELFTLLSHSEIEEILKNENASFWSVYIEQMPPHPHEVLVKLYPFGYKVPQFQKFDGWKVDSKEHVLFLDFVDNPFASHNFNFQKKLKKKSQK